MKIAGFLILVILAFAAGMFFARPSSCGAECGGGLATVSAEDFKKLADSNAAQIIDVRTQDEYLSGHIGGAANADFSNSVQFEKFLDSLDKENEYLIYCRSGNRSGQALKLMEEKGFTSVTNLSGGVLAWQAEGLPLE